ncbi:anaerobic sulfatase-maturating enzyme, partial [gut metagenome]
DFLVGVSVDGYRDLHDYNRVDAAKKGSYSRVVKTVKLLQQKGVDVNLLCVVTGLCARHPQKVYAGLKKLGGYLQFIPCLDPLEEERGSAPYSLTPEAYGDFLCGLFDEWFRDWEKGQYISVRLFDDYVHLALGEPAGTCATSGGCGSYFVVEGDGSIYPCDFYVLDPWRMGTVQEQSLQEMANGETARRFLKEGSQRPAECANCQWLRLCNGGCRRDWIWEADGTHNYYCGAFQKLFEHAASRIQHIARCEMQMRRMCR